MSLRHSVANIVLVSSLLLVTLVGVLVLFEAGFDLHIANRRIESVLTSIRLHVQHRDISSDGSLTPQAKAFLDQLEGRIGDGVESSTITFLFQVFSMCLVGVGVYLASQAKDRADAANKHAAECTKISENFQTSLETGNAMVEKWEEMISGFEHRFTVSNCYAATLVLYSVLNQCLGLLHVNNGRKSEWASISARTNELLSRVEAQMEELAKNRDQLVHAERTALADTHHDVGNSLTLLSKKGGPKWRDSSLKTLSDKVTKINEIVFSIACDYRY